MHLVHIPQDEFKKTISKVVFNYLDPKSYKLFVFGSRATGRGSDNSDIDIGIEGPRAIPGHLKLEIEEAIDKLNVLYPIDLVDFKAVSNVFYKNAKSHVEYINE